MFPAMNAVTKMAKRFNRHLFKSVTDSRLVYNTCWEDPKIDRQLLEIDSNSSVLMISSAGCNALDYLLDKPASIDCVDINRAQNALLNLKIALFENGNYGLLWNMFGEGKHRNITTIYRRYLRQHLYNDAQKFWDAHIDFFLPSSTSNSFYYRGTTGLIANIIRKHLLHKGVMSTIHKLLNAESLPEQQYYFEEIKPHLWTNFSRWLLNSKTVLSCLGVPKKQQKLIGDGSENIQHFVLNAIEEVFTQRPVRDNYFWQAYLTGSYTKDCCPNYLKQAEFDDIRTAVECINISTDSFLNFLKKNSGSYSHFVLLDHQDWLVDNEEAKLAEEWQLILRRARPGAKILFRSASSYRNFLPKFIDDHVHFVDSKTKILHSKDRVGTYGSTHLAIVDNPL